MSQRATGPLTPAQARERLGGPYPPGPAPGPASPAGPAAAPGQDHVLAGHRASEIGGHVWYVPATSQLVQLKRQPAVVLVVEGNQLDLWLGSHRVVRVDRERAIQRGTAEDGTPWEPLQPAADAALRFERLVVSTTVQYRDPRKALCEGTLQEKCRYGGLVCPTERPEVVVAVGFQQFL